MITASSIERAHKCEGSMALPRVDEKHGGQDDGNERHKEWEDAINAGNPPPVLVEHWPGYTWRAEVAFAFDVSTGEGWEIGSGIGRSYGDLGPFCIAGTADAVGRGPNGEIAIPDRKSFDPNVSRSAANGQLHTLALAATRAYGVDECEVAIFHEVRRPDITTLDFIALETFHIELRGLLERAAAARRKVRDGIGLTLTPGSHCRYCSAFHSCKAQEDLALDVRSGSADMRIASISLDSDEDAARAYEFLKRVKMLSARLSTMLYARGAQKPFAIGDGKWFGKHSALGNTEIDADIAYAVIREKHGQGIADAAVSRKATQSGIEKALEIVGAKGQVAALKRDVMKAIKDRGGLKREEKERVEEFAAQLKAVND
jgi:hypothetical protein